MMKWEVMNKNRSTREIVNLISNSVIEKVCTIILVVFVSIPMTSAFFNNIKYNLMYSQVHWYNANLVIGFMGINLVILLLLKRKYNVDRIPIKQLINNNRANCFLILFLTWSVVSVVFANNYYYAIMGNPDAHGGLVSYLMYFGIYVLVNQLRNDKYRVIVLEAFVFFAVIMTLICFINSNHLMAFFNIAQDSGNFGNSNHYGYYLVMAIMINETLLISGTNKYFKVFHLIQLVLLINGLINAKSMGPLLAIIIGTLALVIFTMIKERKKIIVILSMVLVILVTGSISSIKTWDILNDVFTLKDDINTLTNSVLSGKSSEEFEAIGSSRGELWAFGIKKIINKPLLGYGPNNFEIEYQNANFTNNKPHNEFIEIAGTFGIIGLLLYLSVLLMLLMKFIKNFLVVDFLTLGIYCTLGAYLISSFFGNIVYTTFPLYIIILALGSSKIKQV